MNLNDYFEKIKSIQIKLVAFIENEEDIEENYENFTRTIFDNSIFENRVKFKLVLELLLDVVKSHNRSTNFLMKIRKIIDFVKDKIKQTFSNIEIFNIFKNSKIILLILIKENIITIDKSISEIMMKEKYKKMKYPEYFYEEIKQFINDDRIKQIMSKEITDKYEEKRRNGENESYICKIIREDLIEEFIIHVNRNDLSLQTTIQTSIYETNSYLLKKEPTLIEYSAFFGSVQIFRYLYLNNAETDPTIWLYAIHGNNPELVSFLEENSIQQPNDTYEKCLEESIKCHHNDFTNYILNEIDENEIKKSYEYDINAYCFHYHSFLYINTNEKSNDIFLHACHYDYINIVEYFLISKQVNINEEINPLHLAAERNNQEIIDLLLSQPNIFIPSSCFKDCTKLTKISIPSCIIKIEPFTFENCSSLMQISIPSSVTFIGSFAFIGCSSLTQISIPSSVTSIGTDAFNKCSSLTQISIPPFITSINDGLFKDCSSLTQISIPPSVTSIRSYAFYGCKSLTQISIPSSVTSIEKYAFTECSSLTQITIPSSVKKIGDYAFSYCSSLTQISIPSSVQKIGNHAFFGCFSLTQISIPSTISFLKNNLNQDIQITYI